MTERSQELCILRDISDTGLRAELYCNGQPGDAVLFEMRTGHRISGGSPGSANRSIGVQFDTRYRFPRCSPIARFDDRLGRMLPPRIDVEIPGIIVVSSDS